MGLFSTFDAVEILKRDAQIASLTAEIERLRALVKDAFEEGFDVATGQPTGLVDGWLYSETRAALQPKEEK